MITIINFIKYPSLQKPTIIKINIMEQKLLLWDFVLDRFNRIFINLLKWKQHHLNLPSCGLSRCTAAEVVDWIWWECFRHSCDRSATVQHHRHKYADPAWPRGMWLIMDVLVCLQQWRITSNHQGNIESVSPRWGLYFYNDSLCV